jgi:predicted nucleotidyltransferase
LRSDETAQEQRSAEIAENGRHLRYTSDWPNKPETGVEFMTQTVGIERDYVLARAEQSIRDLEPAAQIYLYGSRARGDHGPESDWDLLVILDGVVDTQREERLWLRLYDLRLELNEVLSAAIVSKVQWTTPPHRDIPLFEEVRREGIAL